MDPTRMDPAEHTAVGRQISFSAKVLRRSADTALAAFDCSLADWIVLNVVTRCPDFNQRRLASVIQIEGPTLTRHLDRMEARGLIARERDPADRRSQLVSILPAGASLLEQLRGVMETEDARLVAGIPPRNLATFRKVLDQITRNASVDQGADDVPEPI